MFAVPAIVRFAPCTGGSGVRVKCKSCRMSLRVHTERGSLTESVLVPGLRACVRRDTYKHSGEIFLPVMKKIRKAREDYQAGRKAESRRPDEGVPDGSCVTSGPLRSRLGNFLQQIFIIYHIMCVAGDAPIAPTAGIPLKAPFCTAGAAAVRKKVGTYDGFPQLDHTSAEATATRERRTKRERMSMAYEATANFTRGDAPRVAIGVV